MKNKEVFDPYNLSFSLCWSQDRSWQNQQLKSSEKLCLNIVGRWEVNPQFDGLWIQATT